MVAPRCTCRMNGGKGRAAQGEDMVGERVVPDGVGRDESPSSLHSHLALGACVSIVCHTETPGGMYLFHLHCHWHLQFSFQLATGGDVRLPMLSIVKKSRVGQGTDV